MNVFLVCAAIGGTVMAGQLLLGLTGLGDHGDHGHALGDGADHDAGVHEGEGGHGHGPAWLGLLGLRALMTALALFGLAGLAALHAGLGAAIAVAIAAVAGLSGIGLTAALSRALLSLRADGTLRLRDAIGKSGVVYLTVPAGRGGVGKVTLLLQGRTVECEATTSQDALPTGSRVLVVDVLGPGRLAVEQDPAPLDPEDKT